MPLDPNENEETPASQPVQVAGAFDQGPGGGERSVRIRFAQRYDGPVGGGGGGGTDNQPPCTNCADPTPTVPGEPGPNGPTEPVTSADPNQKIGPSGFGEAGFVVPGRLLPYRVDFENDAEATAPAQRVDIIDQLSSDLDWNTLQFTEVGFGDTVIAIPPGRQYFQTSVGMNYNNQDFEVDIQLAFQSETGRIHVSFQSLDPNTSLPPDVLTGFLPPEDQTGRGMGYFSYTISSNPNLPTGTEIRNIALITFDRGETIATNQIDPHDPTQGTNPNLEALVTIDAAPPTSQVASLPTRSGRSFLVNWSGTDDAGGSGVGNFTIYVSEDGGPFQIWLTDTDLPESTFVGQPGHDYAFYSIAKDNVGHQEPKTIVVEALTHVAEFPRWNITEPHDTNDDGLVSPIDVLLIINRLNSQGAGDLTFEDLGPPYWDTNKDNFVSPIDVLLVINYLNSRSNGEGESAVTTYQLPLRDTFAGLPPVEVDSFSARQKERPLMVDSVLNDAELFVSNKVWLPQRRSEEHWPYQFEVATKNRERFAKDADDLFAEFNATSPFSDLFDSRESAF